MKFKADHYSIFNKGRTYDVLAFPRIEEAWAFDDYPEDDQLMIDGSPAFFQMMQYALAALISDPSKIIYFPIHYPGETRYGATETYDAVLIWPELQFRRSEWYDLKPKLNRKHWIGKYPIRYNRTKLDDYWKNFCKKHAWMTDIHGRCFSDKFLNGITEDLLGNTVFLVLPKDVCHMYHCQIASALDDFDDTAEIGSYVMIGYIMSKTAIETWNP